MSLPKGLELRKLYWSDMMTWVVALSRRNEEHGAYLADFCRAMQPKHIITSIQPDQPYFINTTKSYQPQWKEFLKSGVGSFLVNPWPKQLKDVIFSPDKLNTFIRMAGASGTKFHVGMNHMYSENPDGKDKMDKLEMDNLLTPLLWGNHNSVEYIIAGGLPELLHRDLIAKMTNKLELEEMFDQYIREYNNSKFDIKVLYHELFYLPLAKYLAQVVKHSVQNCKELLLVIEYDMLQFLESAWREVDEDLNNFQKAIPLRKMPEGTTLAEYIEQQVILDHMLPQFVNNNFIPHDVFPWSAHGAKGVNVGAQRDLVIDLWRQYYVTYEEKIHGVRAEKPEKTGGLADRLGI